MPERLPNQITTSTPQELFVALAKAWQLLDLEPNPAPQHSLLVLLAQWALETGNGKFCHAYNLGNIKSRSDDGRDFTYFACNEILNVKDAEDYVKHAAARSDDTPGLNAQIKQTLPGGKCEIWFYPDHPGARFRAYQSLREGATDYLDLLQRRFKSAWPAVVAGDPSQFVHLLKIAGYFTANEEKYRAAVASLFAKFQKLNLQYETSEPPPDTQTAAEARLRAQLDLSQANADDLPHQLNMLTDYR